MKTEDKVKHILHQKKHSVVVLLYNIKGKPNIVTEIYFLLLNSVNTKEKYFEYTGLQAARNGKPTCGFRENTLQ